MRRADCTLDIPLSDWAALPSPAEQAAALAALEDGKVVVLPLPFAVTSQEEGFLTGATLGTTRKNVSYDPATHACRGAGLEGEPLARLAAMLKRYGDQTESLLRALLPRYAPLLRRARTSFRPAEIAGRAYSARHDDRRLHIDAFPSRPTGGDRILRIFTNAAPNGTVRHWRVGEPFPDYAARFLPRIHPMRPLQSALMATLGLTKGRRTGYDHLMLGLHDQGKYDTDYQATAVQTDIDFTAGTTWLCFTDQVLHAALSGHCAFEQTFLLPLSAMATPETAPLHVLARMTGRVLV
jgi:hypothetical protein